MRFSTLTATPPTCSPKSLPMAFARVNMFKSAVVSDCLMMAGKFANRELGSCHKPSRRFWSYTSHSFAVEGPPGRSPSFTPKTNFPC